MEALGGMTEKALKKIIVRESVLSKKKPTQRR